MTFPKQFSIKIKGDDISEKKWAKNTNNILTNVNPIIPENPYGAAVKGKIKIPEPKTEPITKNICCNITNFFTVYCFINYIL